MINQKVSQGSNPGIDSSADIASSGVTRRSVLASLGALVVSGIVGCSDDNANTNSSASAQSLSIELGQQLGSTAKMIEYLKANNGQMSEAEYKAAFVDLFRALAKDLSENFGVYELPDFNAFEDLKIDEIHRATLNAGFVFAYYPSQNAAGGGYAIEVTIKQMGERPLAITLPAIEETATVFLPKPNFPPVHSFTTVLATSGKINPVGTTLEFRGQTIVAIDREQIQSNGRAAQISSDDMVLDVILNEVGHAALRTQLHLGSDATKLRGKSLSLVGIKGQTSLINFEELYSDFYTLKLGRVPLAYYILTLESRTGVAQYETSLDIFEAGLRKGVASYQRELAAAGMPSQIQLKDLASQLHWNPKLSEVAAGMKRIVVEEYENFVAANMSNITKDLSK